MIKSYKELIVWQKSIDLTLFVYKLTKQFPKEELFGLTSQMRRASVAIPSNIAEGYNRGYKKEYVQFLRIAFASDAELETQSIIALHLDYMSKDDSSELTGKINEVSKMLRAMIESLENRSALSPSP